MEINFDFSKLAKEHEMGSTIRRYTEVDVEIVVSEDLILEFAKGIRKAYEFVTPSHMSNQIPDVMAFQLYLKALVTARVMQCAEQRLPMRPGSREWVIPHVFFAALGFIGNVQNAESLINVRVKPVPKRDRDSFNGEMSDYHLFDTVKTELFQEVAEFLIAMEDKIRVARGLPRSIEGNYEFMMFQVIDGKLMHYMDKVDPGTALVATFLQAKISQTVFTPRFCFGTVSDGIAPIRDLVRHNRA